VAVVGVLLAVLAVVHGSSLVFVLGLVTLLLGAARVERRSC
jgi:hypothetical protein